MSNKARVLKHLQALSIPCEVYEHPAVFTGQSRILCKVQNVAQIEQNLCKTGAAHAAAALFIK